jgi:hypothetical protein
VLLRYAANSQVVCLLSDKRARSGGRRNHFPGIDYAIVAKERNPAHYVDGCTLRFTVPTGDTDQAAFELTSN